MKPRFRAARRSLTPSQLRRPAIKRSLARLSADVVGRVLQLGILVVVARQLDENAFGQIVLGSAAGLILSQLIDLGLQLTVASDVAVRVRGVAASIGSALGIKAVLALGAAPCIVALYYALGADSAAAGAALVAAALCLDSFVQFSATTLRAAGAFRQDWIVAVAPRLVSAGFVIPVALAAPDPPMIGGAWLLAAMTSTLFSVTMLARHLPIERPRWDLGKGLLARSWPIGMAIFFGMAYTRVGLFMIELLRSSADVAVYGVASRLMEPTYLVPAAGVAIFYPSYSRTLHERAATASAQLRRWVLAMGAIGGGTYILLAVAGPPVASLLFGAAYGSSGDVLRLLGLVVIPGFISYLLNQALIAEGHARYNLTVMGVLLVVSVFGNLLAVTAFGYWGAAGVAVMIELLLLGALLHRKFRLAA